MRDWHWPGDVANLCHSRFMTNEVRTYPTQADEFPSLPSILKPAQAAEMLQVSIAWLKHERINGGSVPFFRVGRQARYRKADIQAWIESQVENVRAA